MPGTLVQLEKITIAPLLFELTKPILYMYTYIQFLNFGPQTYDIPTIFIDIYRSFLSKTIFKENIF